MIIVRGPSSQSGWGVGVFGLLKLLQESGFEPKFFQINAMESQHRKGFSKEDLEWLDSISTTVIPEDSTLIDCGSLIYALTVDKPKVARHIIYTNTETTSIHKDYVEMLNTKFDNIWTTSNYIKVGFISSGVTKEVKVLPHYIDLKRFSPEVKPLAITNLPAFNFLMNVDFSYRKGVHLALMAWIETFKKEEDVGLILKITNGNVGLDKVENITLPLNEMLYKMNYMNLPHAPIFPIFDSIESKDMPSLYRTAQCNLNPTLGEGFNLSAAEAMTCGIPLIISRCGGQLDYVNKTCGCFIELDSKQSTQPVQDPSLLQRDPRYRGLSLFNIDYNNLKEKMRYAFENQNEMKECGLKARERIVQKIGYETLSKKIQEYLK